MKNRNTELLTGIFFAILWSSASTATKVALHAAQPLTVAIFRFAIASFIMLVIVHVFIKEELPQKNQWKKLFIYGLLNIAVYLGLYVVAMKEVTAGIGALTVAASPVFISFLSVFIHKKPLSRNILLAMIICLSGFAVLAYPLIDGATVTVKGLLLLIASMFSYALGTIYFTSKKWDGLHLLTINGWQTLFGGILLFPIMLFTYSPQANHYNKEFWMGAFWLAVPVSIVAVLLWLRLIKADAVRAGFWLFVAPIFGIIIAAFILHEPVSIYTFAGLALVLFGLAISRYKSK